MACNDHNIYKTGRRVLNNPSAANKVENTGLSSNIHDFNIKYNWSNMFCDHFSWYDRKEKLIKFSFCVQLFVTGTLRALLSVLCNGWI